MNESSNRFRLGATIFVVGFASPLLIPLVVASSIPVGWKTTLSGFLALGDVLLISSLFVLGREFWDKLRALFHHGSTAVFPE